MPRGLDDLRVLESDPLVLFGQVAGGAPDIVGSFRLARDAGDPQKIFEFRQSLLAGIFKEFFRGDHY